MSDGLEEPKKDLGEVNELEVSLNDFPGVPFENERDVMQEWQDKKGQPPVNTERALSTYEETARRGSALEVAQYLHSNDEHVDAITLLNTAKQIDDFLSTGSVPTDTPA